MRTQVTSRNRRDTRGRRPARARLLLERLEDRTLPDGGGSTNCLAALPPGWNDEARIGNWINLEYVYDVLGGCRQDPGTSPPPGGGPGIQDLGNILVNDPFLDTTARDTQSETTLVLVPGTGGLPPTIVVGYNDSGSNAIAASKFTGWSRSTDGGATFTDKRELPTNPRGDRGDPVMARDDLTGAIYYSTLSTAGVINVFRSFDGGDTFTAPTIGTPGGSGEDKQWHTVDNFAGPGRGNVYLISRSFGGGNGIFMYRSTDGGATFGPTGGVEIVRAIGGNVQGAYVAVGPDHTVYAFWFDNRMATQRLMLRRSTDFGVTFGPQILIGNLATTGVNGDQDLRGIRQGTATPAFFRSNAFPHVAVNPVSGHLYLIHADNPAGVDKADVMFRMSTDQGATWSAPLRINTDTTTRDNWMPTIAVTPNGGKVGVFWYDRRLDPANNLIDRFGRVGVVSGSTVNWLEETRITNVSFLPEFGRDPAVNSVYMGDYDQAVADNSAFYLVWGDNRDNSVAVPTRKTANVRFAKISLGLTVAGTTPAAGSIVTAPPTTFVVDLSDPYVPASVQANDFRVNSIAADFVTLSDSDTLTFTFATSPVTAQGLQTMTIAADAITRLSDGDGIDAFTATFRFDIVPMQLTPDPPSGTVIDIPQATLIMEINSNEPIAPGSVDLNDLTVSQGIVTAVQIVNPQKVRYTVDTSGITAEGALNFAIAAGAYSDSFGNPNLPLAGSYIFDFSNVALPPFTAKAPLGSLIYDPVQPGTIGFAGDTDGFLFNLDGQQLLTVVVDPASTLRPTIEVFDPLNQSIGAASSAGNGLDAVLQTIALPGPGSYAVHVGGVGTTTGAYTVQVILNAAVEMEKHNGPANNTQATAQNLHGSLITLDGPGSRGAVLGRADPGNVPDWYSLLLDENDTVTLAVTALTTGIHNVRLVDPDGNDAALGLLGPTNVRQVIRDFRATAAGTYFAVVTGTANTDYSLLYTRNAAFDTEPNDVLATAQDVLSGQVDGEQRVLGHAVSNLIDHSGGFVNPSNLTRNGSAVFTSDIARLTPAAFFQRGSFFSNTRLNIQSFTNSFTFQILPGTTPMADGLTFTIQGINRFQLGGAGGNLGYTGIPASVAVKFDIFNNVGEGTNSTGLYTNGAFPGLPAINLNGTGIDLNSQNLFQVDMAYNGTVLNVTIRDTVTSASASQAYAVNIPAIVGGPTAFVGFTGATGGLHAIQEIQTWTFLSREPDLYKITLDAEATLQLATSTPADGPGEFFNNLDPRLRLLNAAGTQVAADDNSAADGRNARLSFTAGAGGAGTYFVEVTPSPTGATSGEYVLSIKGQTPTLPAFRVTATLPANGARVRGPTTQITLDFNDAVLLSSLQESDLMVDGEPATGLIVVDGDTVRFTLPAGLAEGNHDVAIAAGAILDVQGTPVQAFAMQFYHDITPPQVVSSSIQEDDVLPTGNLTYTVGFSERMRTTNLDAFDFVLVGQFTGGKSPASFAYNAAGDQLTISYTNLPEDRYVLGLTSGNGQFEDVVGFDLDGSPSFPLPSGDGVEGGNFVVFFFTDLVTASYPTPLTPKLPSGSLIYDPVVNGLISHPGDTDSFTLNVDAGQTISVLIDPGPGLQPTVELRDPSNVVMGSGTAPAPGAKAVLQTIPVTTAGIYTVRVSGEGTDRYSAQVILNAALELEANDGPSNDTAATAQAVDGSLIPLLKTATRGAVLGKADAAGAADYYSFIIPEGASQKVTLAAKGLGSGTLNLELRDESDAILATGTAGATNLDKVIYNFGPLAPGIYFIRVTGTSGLDYSLVGTGDAVLDREPNNTSATAQDFTGTVGGLGHVSAGVDLFGLPGTPVSGALILAGSKITLGIHPDGSFITGLTGIQFLTREFVQPGTPLAGFTIGRSGANFTNKGACCGTQISVTKENISSGSLRGVRIVGIVGGNLRVERVVAFNADDEFVAIATRLTNLASSALNNVAWLENLDPDQGLNLGVGFATFNDVVLGGQFVRADAKPAAFPGGLTIGLGSTDPRRVVSAEGFDNRDPFAIINSPEDPNGAFNDIAINLAFNYGTLAAAGSVSSFLIMAFGRTTAQAEATYSANTAGIAIIDDDWYAVTLAAGQIRVFETMTPADGSGQFVNTLNPRIDVFDPAGNPVGTREILADGRNERITITAASGGVYRIRVTAEGGTRGEYFLDPFPVAGGAGQAPVGVTRSSILELRSSKHEVPSSKFALVPDLPRGPETAAAIPPAAGFVAVVSPAAAPQAALAFSAAQPTRLGEAYVHAEGAGPQANAEGQMTNAETMPKAEGQSSESTWGIRHSEFSRHSAFDLGLSPAPALWRQLADILFALPNTESEAEDQAMVAPEIAGPVPAPALAAAVFAASLGGVWRPRYEDRDARKRRPVQM